MKNNFEKLITFGLVLAMGVLVIVGGVGLRTTETMADEALLISHTHEVIGTADLLLSTLTDGETGTRGYIITNDQTYLEPYYSSIQKIHPIYNRLSELVKNNPRHQPRLSKLKLLIDNRLKEFSYVVELSQSAGFDAARHRLLQGHGKNFHDQVRLIIKDINLEEQAVLKSISWDREKAISRSHWILASGTLIAVAITLAAMLLLHRMQRVQEELEDRLRKTANQAMQADHLKSAFLATMSHELRTPLNSIIGFTGVILNELPGPLNPEQKKQLALVKDSSLHLLALINDVLDLSKIEAGQLEISWECFNLADSLQKIVKTLQPQAEAKRLAFIAKISPDLGNIYSDQRRLEQIVINLLSNAIKFTDHGTVTLIAEQIDDYQSTDGRAEPAMRLQVLDTGIGIKPEELQALFSPFQQVQTSISRHYEGTGLGLAISKRLVKLLGGSIEVESEFGKGSTFTCIFPIGKTLQHA